MNRILAALTSTLVAISVNAAEVTTVTSKADPHYSEAGFFDLRVCNWPVGLEFQWVRVPPGNFAPAGGNRKSICLIDDID